MYSIERIETLISTSENTLAKYENLLRENPHNFFNLGIVKNTAERLMELRQNLVYEKQKREKEIIDLRLKGKVAKFGKLPLELLGDFANTLSECLVESARNVQFGNKATKSKTAETKRQINLTFEKLVSGSTHILITANTTPDLFGNSMIESGLKNTFGLLNVEDSADLIEKSASYGTIGIKKIQNILALSLKNDLEFDLTWEAPNMERFFWEGNKQKILLLINSFSKIEVEQPIEYSFKGTLIMESLKGQIEVLDENKKLLKIVFPLKMLESVKKIQIGDSCQGIVYQRISRNTVTHQEKVVYELKEIN